MSTQVQQVDLWGKEGLKYSVEHARAKLAMLGGGATREEEERQVEDGARDDNLDKTVVNVDLKDYKSKLHYFRDTDSPQICTSHDCS